MLASAVVRVLFVGMLLAAPSVHQFLWNPIWLIPIVIGMLVNLKVALRVPDRTAADIVNALLVVPAELWMWSRMWSTLVSWLNFFFGARRDGWAAQAASESGARKGGRTIDKGPGLDTRHRRRGGPWPT